MFATAIPTKGARSREMDENNERGKAHVRQPEDDLYNNDPMEDILYRRRTKREAEKPPAGTDARGSTDVVSHVLLGSWAKIKAYVDDVTESSLLSEAESKHLQLLMAQQNEQLRLVHAASSFSRTRFVRNVKELLASP
eukprot:1195710-Prorocentrum_minimum.AAC.2